MCNSYTLKIINNHKEGSMSFNQVSFNQFKTR